MNREDCYILGKVTKPQGYQGKVHCFLDTDQPERYSKLESVLLEIQHELVPFFVESITIKLNKAVVKFEGVDTEEDARALVNAQIFLPLDLLPPLSGKQFYFHEILGYQVQDQDNNPVGTVQQVLDGNQNALLEIAVKEQTVLVPINDSFIRSVDREQKILSINFPPDYLETFLS